MRLYQSSRQKTMKDTREEKKMETQNELKTIDLLLSEISVKGDDIYRIVEIRQKLKSLYDKLGKEGE